MSDTILVTGATGNVGHELVNELRTSEQNVRAGVRDKSKTKDYGWDNVDIVEFDYEKPETIEKAMTGATKLFLVAPPVNPKNEEYLGRAIDSAKKTGVKHVVDL